MKLFNTLRYKLIRLRGKLADWWCAFYYGVQYESEYLWCPTQFYGTLDSYPNVEIYIRWRHDNPYTMCVMDKETYERYAYFPCTYKDVDVWKVKVAGAKLLRTWALTHTNYSNFFDTF